jgi:Holliday junction DNA helicase RuvA
MIAHLKGLLCSTGPDSAVVDVGGVGYLVGMSSRSLAALGSVGEAVTVHTEMLVGEEFIRLVGFASEAERDWFRLLTGVQGVGARVALAILSALDPAALHRAIAAQDKAMVARANGVGPKLAERIVRELKDKVGTIATGPLAIGGAGGGTGAGGATMADGVQADALAELDATASLDALVRLALRKAAK